MAYVVDSQYVEVDGTASTTTVELLDHLANDLLIIGIGQDNMAAAMAAPSGWTRVGTFGAIAGVAMQFYYKVASAPGTADPTFSGVADDWGTFTCVIRDADTSTPIPQNNRTDWNNVSVATSTSVTTTSADALLLFGACSDSNACISFEQGLIPLGAGNTAGAYAMAFACRNQKTAGASTAVKLYIDQADEGGNLWTLVIKNKSGGSIGPGGMPTFNVIDYFNVAAGHTVAPLTDKLTTVGGIACDSTVLTLADVTNVADPYRWISYARFGTTLSSLTYIGLTWALAAPINLQNSIFTQIINISAAAMGPAGYGIVFHDSNNNWVAYTLGTKGKFPPATPVCYQVACGLGTQLDSSGTIDWTNITHISYMMQRNNSASVCYVQLSTCGYSRDGDTYMRGGSAIAPITLNTHAKIALGTYSAQYNRVNFQGKGQLLASMNIQFGDGTTPTYVDLNGNSYETKGPYNVKARQSTFNVPDGALSLRLKASASCTMKLRNCILAPGIKSNFVIDSASSTSATYDFSGSLWTNFLWTGKTGIAAADAIFNSCYEIDVKAMTISNCSITASLSANANMKIDDGAHILNCKFTAASAGQYAIRIPTAGTYTLDGTTFTGYTTAVHVEPASSTVTIHLALGQTVPTYTTAGATVVIDQPIVTATGSVSNMIVGGTLYIKNETTGTEMVNTTVASTSYSTTYVNGTGYTAGDTIRMRFRKPTHENVDLTTTATSGGWSFNVETIVDPHFTATTPSNVTVDYVNKKIRATGARDNFQAQEIADIIKVAEATTDGIRLTAFASVSGLVELTPGTYTALTVNLLDWQLSWAAGSVAQAYVGGGNVVGGLAGDLIEDVVGGPQVTVLQAQSGTVVSVGSGVTAQDKIDIANQTKSTMEAVGSILARINALIENSGGDRFTAKALEATPSSGGTDWTATERNQIRKRLGVDGTKATPTSSTPDFPITGAIVDANIVQIMSASTPASNLSAQFDGTTGIVGPYFPVNQNEFAAYRDILFDYFNGVNGATIGSPVTAIETYEAGIIGATTRNHLDNYLAGLNDASENATLNSADAHNAGRYVIRQYLVDNNGLIDSANTYCQEMHPIIATRLEAMLENVGGWRYTADALVQAPSGGGGGTADWTATEKEQIRNRLGIDGTASAPTAIPTLSLATAVETVREHVDGFINGANNIVWNDPVTGANAASAGGLIQETYQNVGTMTSDIITCKDILIGVVENTGSYYRFLAQALELAPAGGGGGTADWTTAEKNQIRNRLGIDGTKATPASSTPTLATADALALVSQNLDMVATDALTVADLTPYFWTTTERNQIRNRLGIDGTKATPSSTPTLARITDVPTAATVASAVRTELATELNYCAQMHPIIYTRLASMLEDVSGWRYTAAALATAGGGGTADWTSTEKEQIRNRLGIDGTASAPTATPTLAIKTTQDAIAANAALIPAAL